MLIKRLAVWMIFLLGCRLTLFAADTSVQQTELERVIDRIAAREATNMKEVAKFTPLIETYVQFLKPDKDLGAVPIDDRYFLGRASFARRAAEDSFLDTTASATKPGFLHHVLQAIPRPNLKLRREVAWAPAGFVQMAVIDPSGLDRQHYDISFLRREFIGEIRCLVFGVVPKPRAGYGRFLGRIWVEDRDYSIVRFNGTYVHPKEHDTYLHFDSWRINANKVWLPAYIYAEESAIAIDRRVSTLRAQTRFWGYSASQRAENEFTAVLIHSKDVNDQSDNGSGFSPLSAERAWERQAEDNVVDRLERSALLAPQSPVDKILETVVNNLLVTNNLTIEPDIRCRVLLTAPIESFTIGHTIVLSRGLLDVLPDEASLGAVLAHELGHIVLTHGVDTKFAFGDRTLFADDQTLNRLAMLRTADEETAADKKAVELLANSPYKDKPESIGLFLAQLKSQRAVLPQLVRGRFGNSLVDDHAPRLSTLMNTAPKLEPTNIQQLAALPLGARLSVDPWSAHVELSRAKAVAVMSAREKLPLQLTPFFLYLVRNDQSEEKHAAAAAEPLRANSD